MRDYCVFEFQHREEPEPGTQNLGGLFGRTYYYPVFVRPDGLSRIQDISAAQVHFDSVILIPLIPPDEGVEADMSFLAASPFMFLRLVGVPQPLLSYGSCFALSQGAEEYEIPFGTLFKFPS